MIQAIAMAVGLAFLTLSGEAAGCVPAHPTGEGFPRVECADGRSYYQDLDGQPYANAAGRPVYAPGLWVEEAK